MEYRKQKKVEALYRALDGGEARIDNYTIPDGDVKFVANGSELDVKSRDRNYTILATDDQEVNEVTILYDKLPEKEDYDLDQIKDAIKNVEDAVYATEKDDTDVTPVVQAVSELQKTIKDIKVPVPNDYTDILEDILKDIKEKRDYEPVLVGIQGILEAIAVKPTFEIPERFVNDNRIKVEVDRIGGGGGGSTQEVVNRLDTANNYFATGTAIKAADSFSIDAFGRWRVSSPETIFDSKQLYDAQPLFWDDQETSGGGTGSAHSVNEAATTISVGATTAGTRVRQTFMRFNYQPGKSQLIICTFGEFDTATGITKRVGYFDDKNGLFLESEEGTINMVRRTYYSGSAVDNEVAQSSWNIDKMDGTGASGITLDFTKTQILWIDFEWLGVGRARMGFVIDGKVYYAHEFLNTNVLAGVYMSTPNLPLRYEISNDGSGAADDFVHICSSVMSEGGVQSLGILRHKDTTAVTSLGNSASYVVMAGRLKSTHLGCTILVENVSLTGSANDQLHWEFVIGGTVGAALSYSDVANSACQVAIGSASHTHTGGTEIDGGYITTNFSVNYTTPNAVHLGAAIDNTPQEWYLVVKPITNNITVRASVTWRELL